MKADERVEGLFGGGREVRLRVEVKGSGVRGIKRSGQPSGRSGWGVTGQGIHRSWMSESSEEAGSEVRAEGRLIDREGCTYQSRGSSGQGLVREARCQRRRWFDI